MVARVVALFVVIAMVGPSVAAATCELTCAIDSHHHGTPSADEASCHEQQLPQPGFALSAVTSTPCHESGDLPSAILDLLMNTAAVSALPPGSIVVAAQGPSRHAAPVAEHRAPFDPRPAHRPLRV
jgi:hypothetical protein